jgi:hypothetical protein
MLAVADMRSRRRRLGEEFEKGSNGNKPTDREREELLACAYADPARLRGTFKSQDASLSRAQIATKPRLQLETLTRTAKLKGLEIWVHVVFLRAPAFAI